MKSLKNCGGLKHVYALNAKKNYMTIIIKIVMTFFFTFDFVLVRFTHLAKKNCEF